MNDSTQRNEHNSANYVEVNVFFASRNLILFRFHLSRISSFSCLSAWTIFFLTTKNNTCDLCEFAILQFFLNFRFFFPDFSMTQCLWNWFSYFLSAKIYSEHFNLVECCVKPWTSSKDSAQRNECGTLLHKLCWS